MNLEYILIGISLSVFVISPFLPNVVYTHFVESYVGAIILLLAAFLSITQGYLVAVSTFSAVGALYAEAHARKAKSIGSSSKATNEEKPIDQQFAPAEKLVPNEVHPDIESPPEEKVTFVPKEEDSSNIFKAVGESINAKTDLPTTSFAKDAEAIYLKDGLAENS